MRSARRPSFVISLMTSASFGAMAVYWGYAGLNGSSVPNTVTGQVFDIDFRRHRHDHGAYVTWTQLETIILLGVLALIFAAIWSVQQTRRNR